MNTKELFSSKMRLSRMVRICPEVGWFEFEAKNIFLDIDTDVAEKPQICKLL